MLNMKKILIVLLWSISASFTQSQTGGRIKFEDLPANAKIYANDSLITRHILDNYGLKTGTYTLKVVSNNVEYKLPDVSINPNLYSVVTFLDNKVDFNKVIRQTFTPTLLTPNVNRSAKVISIGSLAAIGGAAAYLQIKRSAYDDALADYRTALQSYNTSSNAWDAYHAFPAVAERYEALKTAQKPIKKLSYALIGVSSASFAIKLLHRFKTAKSFGLKIKQEATRSAPITLTLSPQGMGIGYRF
jgi:hypothetical protein